MQWSQLTFGTCEIVLETVPLMGYIVHVNFVNQSIWPRTEWTWTQPQSSWQSVLTSQQNPLVVLKAKKKRLSFLEESVKDKQHCSGKINPCSQINLPDQVTSLLKNPLVVELESDSVFDAGPLTAFDSRLSSFLSFASDLSKLLTKPEHALLWWQWRCSNHTYRWESPAQPHFLYLQWKPKPLASPFTQAILEWPWSLFCSPQEALLRVR